MPTNGDYFSLREPVEQILERRSEKAKIVQELPLVKKAIAHLETRIKERDSIEAISVDIAEDAELFQKCYEVNRLLKQALIEEKELLEDLVKEYGPR